MKSVLLWLLVGSVFVHCRQPVVQGSRAHLASGPIMEPFSLHNAFDPFMGNLTATHPPPDPPPDCSGFDTTSIDGQVQQLWCRLRAESPWYSEECDTLLDVNGDNWKDLIIPDFSPTAGSGPRFMLMVYLYHPQEKQFRYCVQVSDLLNPTFDFTHQTVFGWYITGGGGYDVMLKWGENKFELDEVWHTQIEITPHTPIYTGEPTYTFTRTYYPSGRIKRWVQKAFYLESYQYHSLVKGENCYD